MCTPTAEKACNVSMRFEHKAWEVGNDAYILEAAGLGDYLCYMDMGEKGFNVSIFYDQNSFIADPATPK